MAVVPAGQGRIPAEQMQFLEVFANQTAMAIERTRSQNAAEAARMQMETEQMRSSLLSAVSHDLRTPLASITGAASTLRSQGEKLQPETRQELLDSIADEAERLSRLVSNLLDMTRLESGVELRRDLLPAGRNRRRGAAADGEPTGAPPGNHVICPIPFRWSMRTMFCSDNCS